MSETALGKRICLMASSLGHRLFRCNHAKGWVGEAIRFSKPAKINVYPGDVIIRKALPLHAGLCDGQSDYIGWTKNGKFLAIETKTKNSKTQKKRLDEQNNFIKQILDVGGIAGMVEDEEQALELLS